MPPRASALRDIAAAHGCIDGSDTSLTSPEVAGSQWEPLTTFNLFPKLPPEIRHMVWVASLEPRTIRLALNYECPGLIPTSHSPPNLRACHESRDVLKRYYATYSATFLHPVRTIKLRPDFDTVILASEYLVIWSLERIKNSKDSFIERGMWQAYVSRSGSKEFGLIGKMKAFEGEDDEGKVEPVKKQKRIRLVRRRRRANTKK